MKMGLRLTLAMYVNKCLTWDLVGYIVGIYRIYGGLKMIDTTFSKNKSWNVGDLVKVGFLTLRVLGVRDVYDHKPDIYTLESIDGTKTYEFIPHNGLKRV